MHMTERGGEPVVSLTCAETATFVRAALKVQYPTVKFSVRSKSYSGGSSITITWTDGPTVNDVERVRAKYEGATFDGSIDLKEYRTATFKGKRVQFGADYIFCTRSYSREFATKIAEQVATRYGVPACKIVDDGCGGTYFDRTYEQDYTRLLGVTTVGERAWQIANETACVAPALRIVK